MSAAMKKKLALQGSHIEVFVAPKTSASCDIDIATSSLFPHLHEFAEKYKK